MKYFKKMELDEFIAHVKRTTFIKGSCDDEFDKYITDCYKTIDEPELIFSSDEFDIFVLRTPYGYPISNQGHTMIVSGYKLKMQDILYGEIINSNYNKHSSIILMNDYILHHMFSEENIFIRAHVSKTLSRAIDDFVYNMDMVKSNTVPPIPATPLSPYITNINKGDIIAAIKIHKIK